MIKTYSNWQFNTTFYVKVLLRQKKIQNIKLVFFFQNKKAYL